VQLAYLDESKTADAYFITALVVRDRDAIGLAAAMDGVIEYAQDNFGGVREGAELHGIDLVGGQRDWKRYRPSAKIPARIAVYEEAVRVITTFDVRCYIRGANIAGHTARYTADTDIHGTVLPWVLERVQADAKTRRDVALVIADEVARQDRYRADVGDYRKMGTWGWRAQTLDRIADTLHFAPSHASRLLQAADLVSYAHTQSCRHRRDPRATAVWQRIWKALCPSIVKEASCWGG